MDHTHVAAPTSWFGARTATLTGNLPQVGGTDREVVDAYKPLLRTALQTGRAVRIPAPDEPDGWSLEVMEVSNGPEALLFRVTAPDGQSVLNAAVGSSKGWLIEALGPGLSRWPGAATWLPDFSRCLARCWLDERRVHSGPGGRGWRGGMAQA